MERVAIREAVVVEGRDDVSAVLRAVDAAVLTTQGWGLPEEGLAQIRGAYERQGIIILTDPDHAGRRIRERLTSMFPEAKQAYLVSGDASKRKDGKTVDIGVENASPEAIRAALLNAKAQTREPAAGTAGPEDLAALGLTGGSGSSELRAAVGRELGIGQCNAKAFAKRMKAFGITREELMAAWRRISRENR